MLSKTRKIQLIHVTYRYIAQNSSDDRLLSSRQSLCSGVVYRGWGVGGSGEGLTLSGVFVMCTVKVGFNQFWMCPRLILFFINTYNSYYNSCWLNTTQVHDDNHYLRVAVHWNAAIFKLMMISQTVQELLRWQQHKPTNRQTDTTEHNITFATSCCTVIHISTSPSELNHKTFSTLLSIHYRVLLTDLQLPRCFVCVQTLPVNCSFIDGTTDSRMYCITHNTQQQFNGPLSWTTCVSRQSFSNIK